MSKMFDVAAEWCKRHPKWQMICDIDNSDEMALTWGELPQRDRSAWDDEYGFAAESIWREYCTNIPYRHRFGYVGEDGVFYDHILDVKYPTNSVTVYETGGRLGIYYKGGMRAKSSRSKAVRNLKPLEVRR